MRTRRKTILPLPALMIGVACILGLVFYLLSLQVRIASLETQCEQLDQEISYKTMTNRELEDSLENGTTDDDIAKIAREILGYSSPGERVFIDSSSK